MSIELRAAHGGAQRCGCRHQMNPLPAEQAITQNKLTMPAQMRAT
jgi:hypothetical protein